jgi:putative ABC transport system permease protein
MVMGFIVGMAICYQILFTEVQDRLAQFATLKAMGHSDGKLRRVIVEQGVWLAVLGYAVGLVLSLGLFRWLHQATGLTMNLGLDDAALVLWLTLLMCVGSGLLAGRKLREVDPADLFS